MFTFMVQHNMGQVTKVCREWAGGNEKNWHAAGRRRILSACGWVSMGLKYQPSADL